MDVQSKDIVFSNPASNASTNPGTNRSTISQMATILDRLERMKTISPNWDSYGSEPPSCISLRATQELISELYEASVNAGRLPAVPFSVTPLSGGGVQVEWRGDRGAIEVEVNSQGAFGCLIVKGEGSSREFEERDNVPHSQILELVRSIV